MEATSVESDGLLRLDMCPQCGYWLGGLPPEGRCPECGRNYDQTIMVITGKGRGKFDSLVSGTWRGAVWLVVSSAYVVFILSQLPNASFAMAFLVAIAIVTLGQLYAKFFSDRSLRMQLWISSAGVTQVASTREARRMLLIASSVWVIYIPIGLILLVYFARGRFDLVVASGGVATIAATVAIAWHWLRYRYLDVANGGLRLVRWRNVVRVDIRPLGPRRTRIRMSGTVSLVADIEVDLSVAREKALRSCIARWKRETASKEITHGN
jgi:hypothetical protein